MKKVIYLLFTLILMISVVACNQADGPGTETGVTPTHDFTVCDYLQDNAIFLQKKEFVISGYSENGVLIKVEIYNKDNSIIESATDIVDITGEYNVKIMAPKASFDEYKIVVSDSVHTHTFENILFGEVWMFAGEQLDEIVSFDDDYVNKFVRVFNYDNGNYTWSEYNESNISYSIAVKLADELQKRIDAPVAIIDSTLAIGNADSWISYETASNHLKIEDYLISIDRYIETNENVILKTNALSSMYKTFLSELKNIPIRGLVWQQGNTDFHVNDDVDFDKLINNYSYITSNIFLEYKNFFNDSLDIYSIQSGFIEGVNGVYLRKAQELATYQVRNVKIIPTYDCHILDESVDDSSNYVFSEELYTNRIVSQIYNSTYQGNDDNKLSMFTNAVINNNKIILTFSNDTALAVVDEIYGLSVYTTDGLKVPYQFEIIKNLIIVELDEKIFDEEMNYIISYAENNDLYKCNLKNIYDFPVLPFKIEINN